MAEGKADNKNNQRPVVQPGTVVTPGGVETDRPTGTITFDQDGPAQPGSVVAPVGVEQQPPPAPAPIADEPAHAPETALDPPQRVDENAISWTASEFVAHDKTPGWYLMLAIGTAVLAAIVYLVSRDFISVGVVVAAGLVFGVFASHKPRQRQYRVDAQGINVDDKRYNYADFRSFSVVPEGAFKSIVFMPLKRFSPPLSIYYAPEDEDRIVGLLADRLPFEQGHRDAVDSLMRRIRF